MLPKDESQQNAELRQAFLKHLPRRIESVRKRGHRACRGVWDVNTVTLLYQDLQGLAGAAGRYGLVDASECLFQVERLLEPLIRELRMPGAEEKATIEARLAGLSVVIEPEAPSIRTPRDLVVPMAERPGQTHVPAGLTPPEEYWRRFSHREVSLLSSETHGSAPQARRENPVWSHGDPEPQGLPSLAIESPQLVNAGSVFALDVADSAERARVEQPPAEAERATPQPHQSPEKEASRARTGRIFYLADIAPFARELTQGLGQLGYAVDRLESPEELKEMLGSLAPDMILIDAAFFDQIEHLGEFVKRVRQRVPGKLPLLAFSENNDLSARLKAMRAGVDSFVPLPISAHEASLRVREQVETESGDPFRVMIVEDDRAQAMFAESVLRKAGIETLSVTDALDTLEKLEQFRPDLILMDLYMPNISGMELTAIIRERDQFINTPIVFLSGEQDSEKHFEALSAGGDDFLAKPIRPKFLMSAVNNRARRARQLARRRVLDPKDSTTGLFHRSFVIDRLNELLGADDRGRQGGVLFIEIEGAQAIREQKGLAIYEPVMRELGANIANLAQPDELAARFGDSSFLLLSPVREAAELESLAHQIAQHLADAVIEVDQHSLHVVARIGIAAFSPQIADAADMLNAAERASARVKQGSQGGGVMVYEPEIIAGGASLVDSIARALETDGFQLLFQPIVSLHSTGEEQYEVLLRMRGESGEIIGAEELIDAARGAGLLAAVDRWCVGKCMRVVEERKRQGRPVRLFVNQSVESTLDEERVPWLRQLLETRRIAPESIALELKLSDVLASMSEALSFFDAVRKLGVRIVIDEYDGGLTALQLLGVIATDYLKLAEKYTRGSNINAHADELRTLVRAAHDGGRYVIAPKVETAQSAAALWTMGVDLIQGNFVQQPGADLGFDFSASAL